jgi:hypothetical protein
LAELDSDLPSKANDSDSNIALEPSDGEAAGSDSATTSSEAPVSTAPACEKCRTPLTGKQGWCRRCGWYPRLRTFVELDPWDREDLPQPEGKTKLEVCKTLVPQWAWMLVGGFVAVLAASFVMRMILPQQGNMRFIWTVGQMILGFAIFCGAHLVCYIFSMMNNDRFQLLDIVLKPIAIWIIVARELPKTFWHIAGGLWGVAAIFGGLIVGGLADRDLLDWGGTPARYNLTKAIADRAQELAADAKTDKNLQESIEDFAGKAAEPKVKETPDRNKPKLPVDCLIVGYRPLGDNDFTSLILAADLGGKLQIVGTVSEGISKEMRQQLNKRMREILQPNPFIACRLDGKWIQPVLVCKIKAKRWSEQSKLVDPVFQEMLVDVEVQK